MSSPMATIAKTPEAAKPAVNSNPTSAPASPSAAKSTAGERRYCLEHLDATDKGRRHGRAHNRPRKRDFRKRRQPQQGFGHRRLFAQGVIDCLGADRLIVLRGRLSRLGEEASEILAIEGIVFNAECLTKSWIDNVLARMRGILHVLGPGC